MVPVSKGSVSHVKLILYISIYTNKRPLPFIFVFASWGPKLGIDQVLTKCLLSIEGRKEGKKEAENKCKKKYRPNSELCGNGMELGCL